MLQFGRKPKLSAFQIAAAIAQREASGEAGEPLTDIGRSYGVSHSTISRLYVFRYIHTNRASFRSSMVSFWYKTNLLRFTVGAVGDQIFSAITNSYGTETSMKCVSSPHFLCDAAKCNIPTNQHGAMP